MIYGLRQAWLAPLDKKITNSGDIVCFDARSGDFMIDQAERARLEERIRLELDQSRAGTAPMSQEPSRLPAISESYRSP
jgi:hypothetical protein